MSKTKDTVRISKEIESLCSMREYNGYGKNGTDREELRRLLNNAVNTVLTKRQRECVTMYFFERKTEAEIGEFLGIATSTVSRHLTAAKNKLEKLNGYVMR